LSILVLAPIAIPEILMGVSLLIFFVLLNLTLGLVSVALAHIAFCIGFVAIVVRSRLAGMDESLTEAARDCGASPLAAFRRPKRFRPAGRDRARADPRSPRPRAPPVRPDRTGHSRARSRSP
jgi:ABC-type uncharacterized transport system YnjBCD permease subunit